MGNDWNVLSAEMQNLKETERHLTELLASERQNVESKTKSLRKCESVLKAVATRNDDTKQENTSLRIQVSIVGVHATRIINYNCCVSNRYKN